MYAIVRNDAGMAPGKLASQAGHAYVGAFTDALHKAPERLQAYHKEFPHSPGTKVALQASLVQLTRAIEELNQSGLPLNVVYDSGCPDFFGGERTLTAVGFGPCTRDELPKFIRRLKLL